MVPVGKAGLVGDGFQDVKEVADLVKREAPVDEVDDWRDASMDLDLDAGPVEVVQPDDGEQLDGEKVVAVLQEEVCQYFQLVVLIQSAEDLAERGVLEEEL